MGGTHVEATSCNAVQLGVNSTSREYTLLFQQPARVVISRYPLEKLQGRLCCDGWWSGGNGARGLFRKMTPPQNPGSLRCWLVRTIRLVAWHQSNRVQHSRRCSIGCPSGDVFVGARGILSGPGDVCCRGTSCFPPTASRSTTMLENIGRE